MEKRTRRRCAFLRIRPGMGDSVGTTVSSSSPPTANSPLRRQGPAGRPGCLAFVAQWKARCEGARWPPLGTRAATWPSVGTSIVATAVHSRSPPGQAPLPVPCSRAARPPPNRRMQSPGRDEPPTDLPAAQSSARGAGSPGFRTDTHGFVNSGGRGRRKLTWQATSASSLGCPTGAAVEEQPMADARRREWERDLGVPGYPSPPDGVGPPVAAPVGGAAARELGRAGDWQRRPNSPNGIDADPASPSLSRLLDAAPGTFAFQRYPAGTSLPPVRAGPRVSRDGKQGPHSRDRAPSGSGLDGERRVMAARRTRRSARRDRARAGDPAGRCDEPLSARLCPRRSKLPDRV